MKYWAGIDVKNDKVTFKPFTKEDFKINGLVINGVTYNLSQKNGKTNIKKAV